MEDRAEAVRLERITKRFDQVIAVEALCLVVRRGEYVCLLGPSGCGKTTTLRIVAGFVEPDAGTVFIDGQDVSDRPPNKRNIGMVYQSYALFPHMTVFDNVAFGLRMRRVPAGAIAERVGKALELVRLTGLADRKPGQLSGGQQQRVALARALVLQPAVLLLDEPLSNLDAKLRKRMQLELRALQRTVGITTIHVTHDQEEALTLADTVVILNQGRLEQIGRPREVYAEPRNVFVADFLGKSNFLRGRIATCDRVGEAATFTTDCNEVLTVRDSGALPPGTPAEAFIRPERVALRRPGGPLVENTLSGEVEHVIFTGSTVTIEVRTATGRRMIVDRPSGGPEENFQPGDNVEVVLPHDALRLIPVDYPPDGRLHGKPLRGTDVVPNGTVR
jgi:spermidine/putrescine ABC transporter ATP-binding subunit